MSQKDKDNKKATAWQPGYRFRRRISRIRRWTMMIALVLICGIMGSYWYLSNPARVKALAETWLSRSLGGHVTVGKAKLSIFEGLRLDDIALNVDEGNRPEGLLFTAKTFDVKYDFISLIKGDLSHTAITAVEPHVYLTEDADTGAWNYQRLGLGHSSTRPTTAPSELKISLPELVLRNARIDYREIHQGVMTQVGTFAIEARLHPYGDSGQYAFDLQSRGQSEAVGPSLHGTVALHSGKVTATLADFKAGPDLKAMLPMQVRQWWDQHQLAGRISQLKIDWDPGQSLSERAFNVECKLDGVTLTLNPREWRSKEENDRVELAQRMIKVARKMSVTNSPMLKTLWQMYEPVPVTVKDVAGTFGFNEKKITLTDLTAAVDQTAIKVDGYMGGYTPDAPFQINISSPKNKLLVIPHSPRWLASLPPTVREIYENFQPEGSAAVSVQIARDTAGGEMHLKGDIDIVDARCYAREFPYPTQDIHGHVHFEQDPAHGKDDLTLNAQIRGAANGPNQDKYFNVSGVVGPLSGDPAISIQVDGQDIESEPALAKAYPPNVKDIMEKMDADHTGKLPYYRGDFHADIQKAQNDPEVNVNVDVEIHDAGGKLVWFPYPLEHVSGMVQVRKDYVDIIGMKMQHEDGSLAVDGRVRWKDIPGAKKVPGKPVDVDVFEDINVSGKNVPLDAALLKALPGGKRDWIDKLGMSGHLDLKGKVFSPTNRKTNDDVVYDMDVSVHDGSLAPKDTGFVMKNVNGDLRVGPAGMKIVKLTGKRLNADVAATGDITWPHDEPIVAMHIDAKELPLDKALYNLIPVNARDSWDSAKPEGTIDMALDMRLGGPATEPTTNSAMPDVHIVVVPRNLSITPSVMPYRLDQLQGKIEVMDGVVKIPSLRARHKMGIIDFSGQGTLNDKPEWNLSLNAKELRLDDEFKKAVPDVIGNLVKSMNLEGTVDIALPKLMYRSGGGKDDKPDVDFDTKITLRNASMKSTVALTDMQGTVEMAGSVRQGNVQTFDGKVSLPQLSLASRQAKNFMMEMHKKADQPALTLEKIEAEIAGGNLAGDVEMTFPDDGPSRYALNLVLRNADVRQMSGVEDGMLNGKMSASLALEGDWNDSRNRRGRGDVTVSGANMVKIPLLLGFLQVTNLSLPASSAFNQGMMEYSMDGPKVTFETIELRVRENVLKGSGWLDFNSKKVRMTFFTDNLAIDSIPLVGAIVQGAKKELLQFQVNGTLQDPKVQASTFSTVTTTVDEVFKEGKRK